MTFGQQVDEPTAVHMVDMALEAGVNFVDTADVYSSAAARNRGPGAQGRRHRLVLASKVCNFVGEERHRDSGCTVGTWCGAWRRACAVSRPIVSTSAISTARPRTPIEETMAACDALVQQGKVVYVGMSNFAAWQVCEALWKCDAHRWCPPAVMQVPYNLIARSLDEECVAFSRKMGIGIAVYNPLAGGLLTGKHRADQAPRRGPGSRSTRTTTRGTGARPTSARWRSWPASPGRPARA